MFVLLLVRLLYFWMRLVLTLNCDAVLKNEDPSTSMCTSLTHVRRVNDYCFQRPFPFGQNGCSGAGRFCEGCACIDCGNTEENVAEVHKRRHKVNVKNPHAFQDKKVCSLYLDAFLCLAPSI